MNILDLIPERLRVSEQRLARVASYVALCGLSLFAFSLLHPKPLTVILSMSVGHILGAIALLLYLVAVLVDTRGVSQSKGGFPPASSPPVQGDKNFGNQNDANGSR